MGPLFQSIIPEVTHPVVDDHTVIAQVEQQAELLQFDRIARAQSSAPQVVQRVTELENCLWSLATELEKYDHRNPQIERAKLLLNNQLEIFETSEYLREPEHPERAFFHAGEEENHGH